VTGLLRRNVLIHGGDVGPRLKGEWVAVPREDFDEVLAILDRLAPPSEGQTGSICKCGLAKSYHTGQFKQDHEYEPRYLAYLPAGDLERLRTAAQEVWDSVPATYEEADPMVIRHARALNDLGRVLESQRRAALERTEP
jgi:hypothetical protein